MRQFIAAIELAGMLSVSPRALQLAIRRSQASHGIWRGASLVVRTVRGRGGRSGLRYEVLVSSLPLDLQERLKAAERADKGPVRLVDGRGAERDWWHAILAPALAHPKHSRERGAAIEAILSRPLTDWCGRPIEPSRKRLERKLNAIERDGLAGVAPRHRRDKGKPRVIISRAWDKAVPFDDDTRDVIADRLRDYIRGLYKDGAHISMIGQLGAAKLKQLTATYLGKLAPQVIASTAVLAESVFHPPRKFIEAEKVFREVAMRNKDRKLYEDTRRPRIQRTREGLEPMQVVVGDVHHLDMVIRRGDGSEAWPKAIAWLDMATNRIRMDIVLLGKGEGIRNADVIRSFVNMTQDPTWGMPRTLYLDNGSEYRFADFMGDALKLVERGHIEKIGYVDDERSSRIVRARPYNAAAKTIEGIFGTLEQHYFRTIEGWAGGDRTNKKTAKVGKPTKPFAGSFDEFCRVIRGYLTIYENAPQSGALKNRSPASAYRAAIEAGWQRHHLDPHELMTIFATRETRQVRQGAISHGGRRWSCDELAAYLGGSVTIHVPKYEEPSVLPLLDGDGEVFGFARPEQAFGVLDPAGAQESARRAKLTAGAVRKLDRSAPDVDTTAEVMKLATSLPTLPAAPIAGTISVNPDIVAGTAEAPEERADRRRRDGLDAQSKQLAALENLNRYAVGGRK